MAKRSTMPVSSCSLWPTTHAFLGLRGHPQQDSSACVIEPTARLAMSWASRGNHVCLACCLRFLYFVSKPVCASCLCEAGLGAPHALSFAAWFAWAAP